jgi:outer membrane protein TolC
MFSSLASGQEVQDLSLEEALKIGVQNSKALLASSQKVEMASARASEAGAVLLPSLRVEGSYRRVSEVDPFVVQVPFAPSPITISPVVLDNYNLRLGLQQPVFTGFRLKNTARAAEFALQAAEFEHRSDEADLVLNITSAYWLLYQTLEVEKFVKENVDRIEAHLRDTERMVGAGLATQNDLLKINVQLSNAKLNRIDADHDVQVATMTLNNVIGRPLETGIHPASSPNVTGESSRVSGKDLPLSDTLVQKALEERPDLRSMQFRVQSGEAAVSAARGGWWPQVFLTSNYYYSRPNFRYQPTRDEFKPSWDIGVQMQLDVWNWGVTGFQTEQAQAQLHQTQYLYDQMRDNVSLEVTRSYLQVRQSREKVEVARLAIGEAEENVRTTSDKYRNGLATSSDALDADVALLQARTNLTGALVEFELAQARLARAVGDSR